jgi:ATP-binding cassette subfamily F protein 1
MASIVSDKKKKDKKDKKKKKSKKKALLASLAAKAEARQQEEVEEINAEEEEKRLKKEAKRKKREARLAALKNGEAAPAEVDIEVEEDEEAAKKRAEILRRKREKEEAKNKKKKDGDKGFSRTTIAEETLLDDGYDAEGNRKEVAEQGGKKKKKKLTKKERKMLALEQDMAKMDAKLATTKNFPFSISHQKNAIQDPEAYKHSTDINIEEFTVAGTGKKGTALFVEASLKIVNGRRYGFVGKNGGGKTTLLRLIGRGLLKIPPLVSKSMLIVEQEIEGTDVSAIDAVLAADKVRTRLMNEEERLLKALDECGDDDDPEELINQLREVASDLEQHGAANAESKARKILSGLGFTEEMQSRETRKFSGGWRMRVSLARALFIEPNLLLLDEPTNHLDLNAVLWLDNYLQGWKKTVVIVSHDQDFLNNVITDVIHLDQQKLIYYKGNYSHFKGAKEETFRNQVKAYEKQQKQLRKLKASGSKNKDAKDKVVKKQREKGARTTKKEKAAAAMGGGSSAAAAKSEQLLERPKEYKVFIKFPPPTSVSPPIIEIIDASFNYPGHPTLFKGLNFGIGMGDRICIVGPNGVGKSTLLNLIMGDLNPTEGEIKRNRRVRVGRYNQHFDEILPMAKSPVQFLMDDFGQTYQESRNLLGRFGLGGHAHEIQLRNCSGGQKARVVMANLVLQNPHILILDEPTNHLDIETIDALAVGLQNFEGGVVLVSHDARLITEAECDLWVCDKRTLKFYEEGFEGYRDELLDELEEEATRQEEALRAKLASRAKKREQLIAQRNAKKN